MEVVGLAIALIALVVALVALQRSRHGKRRDRRRPAQRLAPDGAARVPAHPVGVHFELRPIGDDQYRLRNFGTEPAYGMKFRAHRLGRNATYDEFPAGHAEEVELTPKADTERNVVEITWHERRDQADPVHHKLLRVPYS